MRNVLKYSFFNDAIVISADGIVTGWSK